MALNPEGAPIEARIATRLAEAAASASIAYIAGDEREAEALSFAVAAITPVPVVYVPSSDAIPGDDAPASPANAGKRAAALRRSHELRSAEADVRLVCLVGPEG